MGSNFISYNSSQYEKYAKIFAKAFCLHYRLQMMPPPYFQENTYYMMYVVAGKTIKQIEGKAAASSEQYVNNLQQIWQPSNQEVLPCTSGQGQ